MFAFCIPMRGYDFKFGKTDLTALPSGALWWRAEDLLCVSDLHLCKSGRLAQRGGVLLPPYETKDTLARLAADIARCAPRTIVCLGDSFDNIAALNTMNATDTLTLTGLMVGKDWIWLEGNHDPGPHPMPGIHLPEFHAGGIDFRHIASPVARACEISGHYHPKIRVPTRAHTLSRPCFLTDSRRLILPAYGTFTGGLWADSAVLRDIIEPDGLAILTGKQAIAVPLACGL